MKDLFSDQSKGYAQFRPAYPEVLYQFIFSHVAHFNNAWDCATGNGQVAQRLAHAFTKVKATDISQKQLDEAPRVDNIDYAFSSAEKTSFPDATFDLVTVAQALHWFNLDAFFAEALRVLKPSGVLAVWGYGNLNVSGPVDRVLSFLYNNVVGPFWDQERRYVEQHYSNILFPLREEKSPAFAIEVKWTVDHLIGYLRSWSATQKYIKSNGKDPITEIESSLRNAWGESEAVTVRFPLFLKLGKKEG